MLRLKFILLINSIVLSNGLLNNLSRRAVLTMCGISAINNLKDLRYRNPILYDDSFNNNINMNHDIVRLSKNNNDNDNDFTLDTKTENNVLIHINDNNIYYNGAITPESCFYLQRAIEKITEETNIEIIKLHLQSIGGSLLPTFGLVDYIKNSPIPIETYITGYVASAATLISVAGSKRYMTKNSMMLIHSLRTVIGEVNYDELEDHYLNSKNMMDIIKNIYKEKAIMTDEKLNFLLQHDYWLNSTECLKYKLVDYII